MKETEIVWATVMLVFPCVLEDPERDRNVYWNPEMGHCGGRQSCHCGKVSVMLVFHMCSGSSRNVYASLLWWVSVMLVFHMCSGRSRNVYAGYRGGRQSC
ncbi:hypothetical protein CEXT_206171 [Caerostris extrusa]|uniref:Uncharacterized protein n=1 Tax=Caerostris extrusa TaxID=172846 RepID=A0AAV4NYJ2_CAEEX|nr:hypothetical protein CEXT_206171 [Caerostris extrusa]